MNKRVQILKRALDHLSIGHDNEYLYHETRKDSIPYIIEDGLLPTSYGQSLVSDDGSVMSPKEKISEIEWRLQNEYGELSDDEFQSAVEDTFRMEVNEDDLMPRTYVHLVEPDSYLYGDSLLRFKKRAVEKDVDYYIRESIPAEEIEIKVKGGWLPLFEYANLFI
jgi:hypothetical protein